MTEEELDDLARRPEGVITDRFGFPMRERLHPDGSWSAEGPVDKQPGKIFLLSREPGEPCRHPDLTEAAHEKRLDDRVAKKLEGEREKFERVFWKLNCDIEHVAWEAVFQQRTDGSYQDSLVRLGWMMWQARASLDRAKE